MFLWIVTMRSSRRSNDPDASGNAEKKTGQVDQNEDQKSQDPKKDEDNLDKSDQMDQKSVNGNNEANNKDKVNTTGPCQWSTRSSPT